MLQRTISGAVFVVVVMACVWGGSASFFALFGVIAAGMGWELGTILFREVPDQQKTWRKVVSCILSVLPVLLAAGNHFSVFNLSVSVVVSLLWMPFILLVIFELFGVSAQPFSHAGYWLLALIYTGLPIATLALLAHPDGHYEPMRITGILILTWMNDTFAYLTGRAFGKTPFFKRISPKKTWEGTLGGVVGCLLVAWLLSQYSDAFTTTQWLLTGLIVAVFGTLGDLIESMLKRSAGIKDSGNIMPGHGGFLDRFDSFVFIVPVVWVVMEFLK